MIKREFACRTPGNAANPPHDSHEGMYSFDSLSCLQPLPDGNSDELFSRIERTRDVCRTPMHLEAS